MPNLLHWFLWDSIFTVLAGNTLFYNPDPRAQLYQANVTAKVVNKQVV